MAPRQQVHGNFSLVRACLGTLIVLGIFNGVYSACHLTDIEDACLARTRETSGVRARRMADTDPEIIGRKTCDAIKAALDFYNDTLQFLNNSTKAGNLDQSLQVENLTDVLKHLDAHFPKPNVTGQRMLESDYRSLAKVYIFIDEVNNRLEDNEHLCSIKFRLLKALCQIRGRLPHQPNQEDDITPTDLLNMNNVTRDWYDHVLAWKTVRALIAIKQHYLPVCVRGAGY